MLQDIIHLSYTHLTSHSTATRVRNSYMAATSKGTTVQVPAAPHSYHLPRYMPLFSLQSAKGPPTESALRISTDALPSSLRVSYV